MTDVQQHPTALVESRRIGPGTRARAFVNILPGAAVGSDCNICDRVFIENKVSLGRRFTPHNSRGAWL